ncbi:hypothetical protein F4861DRAFT_90052 [Xylaria intraflava]|nr:hypothetical protein F4861DRAFT_90052 [Xylaria intraflava]
MAIPSHQKQWFITAPGKDFETLELIDAEVPKVGEKDILVKLHAASLNFRDLLIAGGNYPFYLRIPLVPGSDGAGEVVQVGSKVSKWKVGDRVVTLFNQAHQFGPLTEEIAASGLGGGLDGTLRQYGVFSETGVVRAPKNLNYLEAATLTCAALTSWNALFGLRALKPGNSVLIQGTGGVSIFALQFAKAAGATVIATTSSKEKAESLKKLGADHVINYKEDATWGETARKLTGGRGVDVVVEVGGTATLEQSLKAITYDGILAIVGFVTGFETKATLIDCAVHTCIARGIAIGSRQQMEDMVAAIEANDIHPSLDPRTFTFEETKEAYKYQLSQAHTGKVTIQIA